MIVGTEWLIEATGCAPEALRDEARLRRVFDLVISDLGLKVIDSVWHKFEGEGGVTGMAALTESHLTCHTYPEHGTATFNLYCCRTRPEWDWESNLKDSLLASAVTVTKIERGKNERSAGVSPAVLSASRTQPATSEINDLNQNQKFVNFKDVSIRSRGKLPHWEQDDGIYFVTFRLADSLPEKILESLRHQRAEAEKALEHLNRELSIVETKKINWLFSEKLDQHLSSGYGECLLKDPEAATIVADSLKHFDRKRYDLFAWCVMPNHVHVVFRTLNGNKLEDILQAWKSFTAHEINKLHGRKGELWQREYYDHLVRDEAELQHVVAYTLDNPSKANLKNWKWFEGLGKYRIVGGRDARRTAGEDAGATV